MANYLVVFSQGCKNLGPGGSYWQIDGQYLIQLNKLLKTTQLATCIFKEKPIEHFIIGYNAEIDEPMNLQIFIHFLNNGRVAFKEV